MGGPRGTTNRSLRGTRMVFVSVAVIQGLDRNLYFCSTPSVGFGYCLKIMAVTGDK